MASKPSSDAASVQVGVLGLWHLGCVIAAVWSGLGHRVAAVDLDPARATALAAGEPPLFEPGLAEAIGAGLAAGTLAFSADPAALAGSGVVFLACDTPVRDDDTTDLSLVETALARMTPHLAAGTIVVVSAQLPVGTARRFRGVLKTHDASLELVYSPENLRLGEALHCYRAPGHVVIGAESAAAADTIVRLFAPMQAECVVCNLPTAEMAKHGINAFLATSVTFANQLADLCEVTGADFSTVAQVMKRDPRIGRRSYLGAGTGFSGGTLGRDLRVLDAASGHAAGTAPLFGWVWRYNSARPGVVARRAEALLGGLDGRTIAMLGMTYKPGTSTLRRSLPLAMALDLARRGARVRAHDPRADWDEADIRDVTGFAHFADVYEAAAGADLAILMTEWPEYRELDGRALSRCMRRPLFFDTRNFLADRYAALRRDGLAVLALGRGDLAADGQPRVAE